MLLHKKFGPKLNCVLETLQRSLSLQQQWNHQVGFFAPTSTKSMTPHYIVLIINYCNCHVLGSNKFP